MPVGACRHLTLISCEHQQASSNLLLFLAIIAGNNYKNLYRRTALVSEFVTPCGQTRLRALPRRRPLGLSILTLVTEMSHENRTDRQNSPGIATRDQCCWHAGNDKTCSFQAPSFVFTFQAVLKRQLFLKRRTQTPASCVTNTTRWPAA